MNDKPKYNPNIHHRRSIRLKGYDYSRAGLYFITICCKDRIHRFGHIADDTMFLNDYGQVAYDEWLKLPERFPNMGSDVFQIMPNHMHGIIMLDTPVAGAGFTPARNNERPSAIDSYQKIIDGQQQWQQDQCNHKKLTGCIKYGQPQGIAPTVGDIVGAYKSLTVNGCLEIYKSKNEIMGKFWQRNYHEHIIRNEQSYQTISDYITTNPAKWREDKFYKN